MPRPTRTPDSTPPPKKTLLHTPPHSMRSGPAASRTMLPVEAVCHVSWSGQAASHDPELSCGGAGVPRPTQIPTSPSNITPHATSFCAERASRIAHNTARTSKISCIVERTSRVARPINIISGAGVPRPTQIPTPPTPNVITPATSFRAERASRIAHNITCTI